MANEGQRFRNSLKNYGITFDEHVYDDHKPHLPSHVEAVREQLLDLKHILPWHAVRSAREKEQVHHELLKSLPKEQTNEIYFTGTNGANARSTLGHRPYLVEGEGGKKRISEDHGIQDHEINFMHAVLIAEDARRLNSQGGIDEATFGRRLNTYLFKRWFECGDKSENYDPLDSIVSRLDNTVLHCASEARYQVLRHSPVSFDENLLDPTKSKPDRFFAFPIHTDSDDTRSMPSRFCDQFSLTKLAGLQKFELCSCPVMDLDKYLNEAQTRKHKGADKRREPNKSAPSPGMGGTETAIFGDSNDREADERKSFNSRLLCYPWVIVELKPPGSKEAEILKCYCQALNGASSSLTLLEQLTRHKGEAHAQEPIPPILSLSFIGSEVKVWLAYTTISEVDDSWKMPCWKFLHHSTCIWEGSLRNTLDAVLLCRILDNALFWALRRLRPWIAHHLDAFYDRAQVDKPGLHSGDVIEKRKVDTMRNSDKKRLELQQWEQEIEERQQAVIGQEQSMEDQEREMKKRKKYLKTLRAELYERQENMNEQEEDIMDREDELRRRSKKADESEREVNEREVKVEQREKQAEELKGQLTKREKTLNSAEIRTKEKESGMQKHENALVEREAGCMERINECVKKEIELQHREEAFKAMETETEALITEMHFHVLKHQKKRAEARFLSSETLTITGPGGEEHAEDREKKAKSLSGFHWPRKEPGQSQDKVSSRRAYENALLFCLIVLNRIGSFLRYYYVVLNHIQFFPAKSSGPTVSSATEYRPASKDEVSSHRSYENALLFCLMFLNRIGSFLRYYYVVLNHIQFFPAKSSGPTVSSATEYRPASVSFFSSLWSSSSVVRPTHSPEITAIHSMSPAFGETGRSSTVDKARKFSKPPQSSDSTKRMSALLKAMVRLPKA